MTQTSRWKVLIAERNPLVIAAVRDMIDRDERFDFAGSVQSGEALLEAAARQPPEFDVAIVGWRLADVTGGEVLAEFQRRALFPRVIIFSSDHDVGILKQSVRLGAQGFCYQFEDPALLFQTLVAVANGRICIPYTDVTKIGETKLSGLTTRELELLAVLADGWTNLQIATRTGISENTVKYHLKNLYDKLGVRSRAMAVALYASEKRLGL
jgi:DNA-binding NarL/FixJ family response regulator